jgi:anti-sigma factor ChrR (cupin superfamily)
MTATTLTQALPTILRGLEARMENEPLVFEPLTTDGRNGVEIHRLYTTDQTGPQGPAAGIVRYAPGAATTPHRHNGFEIIHVLEGQMETDAGEFPAGSLLVMEPGSVHAPRSAGGALLLVVWEQPVSMM